MSNQFDKFLEEKFLKTYHGDKENFEDAFDNWLSGLDVNDVIEFGNEFAQEVNEID